MPLLDTFAAIAGTMLTQKANNQAINIQNQANQQALQHQIDATNQYLASNYEGLGVQTQTQQQGYEAQQQGLQQVYEMNLPGLKFMTSLVANPQRLTDAQRYQLGEARRVTGNQIQASGFAGSGRTAAAMMGQVEGDMVRGFMESNRQAAISAASPMMATANTAATSMANNAGENANRLNSLYSGYYDRYGNAITGQANTTAAAVKESAGNVASGVTANAKLTGQALGDIAGSINEDAKKGQFGPRMSRYAT